MKILVLGSGGREHSLCWHLKRFGIEVEAAPGSDAISQICPTWNFKNFGDLYKKIKAKKITGVIVGPEKYLAEGVADFLNQKKISVFGPSKKAAELETDKAFAKDFFKKYKIPTAKSVTIKSEAKLSIALKLFKPPYVIKAAGLAAGKGVWIGSDKSAALKFSKAMLKTHSSVVIEEFLEGEEISYFVMIDGDRHLFLGAAQDHKRLSENDAGPNTGGMGAYSPVSILTPALQEKIEAQVIHRTLEGLKKEKIYYRGFLFVGLMVVRGEPYVLEYNCRMGDPETQALMLRLGVPLASLIERLQKDKSPKPAELSSKVSLNVVVAAKGYPDSPQSGFKLPGLDEIPPGLVVFHSGTKREKKDWVATGGRLFSVATVQDSLIDCQNLIYPWIEAQAFLKKVTYRKDIGVKAYRHLIKAAG